MITFLTPSLHAASITLYVLKILPLKHSLSGTSMFRAYAAKCMTASIGPTGTVSECRGLEKSLMWKFEVRALKTWPASVRSVLRV